jgi:hypothetical protein
MPMIATTIMSSMRVKPCCAFFLMLSMSVSLPFRSFAGVFDDCVREFYGDFSCVALEDCEDGERCIDLGAGSTACLRVPDPQLGCNPTEAERMLPRLEDGELELVCVWSSRCDTATASCRSVCTTDQGCGAPDRICDLGTGECVCTGDAVCQSQFAPTAVCNAGVCGCTTDMDCQAGLSRCLPDGTCGCAVDAECLAQSTQTDKCFDGACGCSGDAGCPPRLAAMDATCESP